MPKSRNSVRFAEDHNETIFFCASAYSKNLLYKPDDVYVQERLDMLSARTWRRQNFGALLDNAFKNTCTGHTAREGGNPREAEDVFKKNPNRGRWSSSCSTLDAVKTAQQPRQPMRSLDSFSGEDPFYFLEEAAKNKLSRTYKLQSDEVSVNVCPESQTSHSDQKNPASPNLTTEVEVSGMR